jgi:hypothetical protein
VDDKVAVVIVTPGKFSLLSALVSFTMSLAAPPAVGHEAVGPSPAPRAAGKRRRLIAVITGPSLFHRATGMVVTRISFSVHCSARNRLL